ncbi:MAG: LysR substrate-binding domain-containing protein [Alphaproteobacteria bacterium]|jgi:DNA-binding transcriptional LysR family regulator|nr:LysR substrate-binding domain-containing protein [Alphaproteobacteria bacterium]
METLDLAYLRTLLAVVDEGSFSRAAKQVHRTQSAVSMQIKRLEDSVGKNLFERVGRRSELTREGTALTDYARRILRLHDEALMAISRPEVVGAVRLGVPDDYMSGFLPEALSEFAESFPQVEVELRCETSGRISRAHEAREIDIGLVTIAAVPQQCRLVRREPVVWATSRRHYVHARNPVPLAVFEPGCIFRKWARDVLDEEGRAYRIAYSSESLAGLVTAVEAGLAVTLLPRSSMPPGFRELMPDEGYPQLPVVDIGLIPPRADAGAAVHALADHISDHVRRDRTS